MAVTGVKRSLPPGVAKMKARKKQKLDGQAAPKQQQAEQKKSKAVKLENLHWQEVAAPDAMDDYEGFFGLEEIDGVDVIREETGGLRFELADSDDEARPAAAKNLRLKHPNEGSRARRARRAQAEASDESDGESWDGFEEDAPKAAVSKDTAATKPAEVKAASKPASKKKAKAQSAESKTPAAPSVFSLLEDEANDSDADVSAWRDLRLSDQLLGALSRMHFSNPTEIQSLAIPKVQDGRDVIGKAPTGSGKTLAFGIPIVEEWLSRSRQAKKDEPSTPPLALIIEPTRELAQQITDHITTLCSKGDLDKLNICTLTGGLSIQKQRRLLAHATIVVATPGRLWEVISEGHGVLASLKAIKYLVVDEADRLLSEGHFKELEQILDALDRETKTEGEDAEDDDEAVDAPSTQRQTLVFSATFSKNLQQKLSRRQHSLSSSLSSQDSMAYLLKKLNFRHAEKPFFIDVNPDSQMASNLREGILECPGAEKDLNLYALLLYHPPSTRALVFVNSISAVRRLVPFLTNLNMTAYPLHSQMPQKARLRSVERFSATSAKPSPALKNGPQQHTILVATDLAARGLDIKQIDLILHYHVPRSSDTYIHRSGRTARAGQSGTSILMCAAEEAAGVRRLVARVHASSSSSKEPEAEEEEFQDLDERDDDQDDEDLELELEDTDDEVKPTKKQSKKDNKQAKKQQSGKTAEAPSKAPEAKSEEQPAAKPKAPRKSKHSRSLTGQGDLHTLSLPPRLISALRPRAALSKTLADASQAKEKISHEDRWLQAAAEELGVSLSDEEALDAGRHSQRGGLSHGDGGKGRKRKLKERAASGMTKAEMAGARAELKMLLGRRVNVGVSEKYLTGGGLDVNELLRSRADGKGDGARGEFLGSLESLGF